MVRADAQVRRAAVEHTWSVGLDPGFGPQEDVEKSGGNVTTPMGILGTGRMPCVTGRRLAGLDAARFDEQQMGVVAAWRSRCSTSKIRDGRRGAAIGGSGAGGDGAAGSFGAGGAGFRVTRPRPTVYGSRWSRSLFWTFCDDYLGGSGARLPNRDGAWDEASARAALAIVIDNVVRLPAYLRT